MASKLNEHDSPVVVEGLDHHYGKGELRKQVLHNVCTEIPRGEIVIVTGPSGSGKTTMLTLIGALRAAQSGSLRVLGRELSGARARVLAKTRRDIGFIFQQHNLLEALSAQQNVELGIKVSSNEFSGSAAKRAREMLVAVGLTEHMSKKPDQMSGGQKQRVAIARALAAEPAMLLADEPTASLDKQSGREVVERMQKLARQQGTTILLVTHDNRILDIADRIVHLEDGKLSTFTDAVLAQNQHMMNTLAEQRGKQDLSEVVAKLDEKEFRGMLNDMTEESRRFREAARLSNDRVFQSMLRQGLFAFTHRLGRLLKAERASLFVVDHENNRLVLRVAEDLPKDFEIEVPIGTGLAGAAAASGEVISVADAYADPRFNKEIDKQTGFKTQSVLALPIKNAAGVTFAVAQLLNRSDGQPFDAGDEQRFSEFMDSLGYILETLEG